MLRCYWQKQYKSDHKGLTFGEATKFFTKPKREIVERISDAISNPHSLVRLSETIINVKKLRDSSEAYPDFLSTEKIITLICSSLRIQKITALKEIIMALKNKIYDISSLLYFI